MEIEEIAMEKKKEERVFLFSQLFDSSEGRRFFSSFKRNFFSIAGFKLGLMFRIVYRSVGDMSEEQVERLERVNAERRASLIVEVGARVSRSEGGATENSKITS